MPGDSDVAFISLDVRPPLDAKPKEHSHDEGKEDHHDDIDATLGDDS